MCRIQVLRGGRTRAFAASPRAPLLAPSGARSGSDHPGSSGERALGVTEQLGDHVGRGLAACLGDALQALRVLALNADKNEQFRRGIGVMVLDVARVELSQLGIEVTLDFAH
jgi:hypothetical protein